MNYDIFKYIFSFCDIDTRRAFNIYQKIDIDVYKNIFVKLPNIRKIDSDRILISISYWITNVKLYRICEIVSKNLGYRSCEIRLHDCGDDVNVLEYTISSDGEDSDYEIDEDDLQYYSDYDI